MKPSEGMKAGISLVIAEHGIYLDQPYGKKRKYHGCALGTMMVGAVGDANKAYDQYMMTDTFNYVESLYGKDVMCQQVEHPVRHTHDYLSVVIESLFEYHNWSRQKITAWLEGMDL